MERETRSVFALRSRRFIVPAGEKVFYARQEFERLKESGVYVASHFDQTYLTKLEGPEKPHEVFGRELVSDVTAASLQHKFGSFYQCTLRDLAVGLRAQLEGGADIFSSSSEHGNVFFIPDEAGKMMLACIRCLVSGQWRLYTNSVNDKVLIPAGSWVFAPLAP